jgi:hypothetical protein
MVPAMTSAKGREHHLDEHDSGADRPRVKLVLKLPRGARARHVLCQPEMAPQAMVTNMIGLTGRWGIEKLVTAGRVKSGCRMKIR